MKLDVLPTPGVETTEINPLGLRLGQRPSRCRAPGPSRDDVRAELAEDLLEDVKDIVGVMLPLDRTPRIGPVARWISANDNGLSRCKL